MMKTLIALRRETASFARFKINPAARLRALCPPASGPSDPRGSGPRLAIRTGSNAFKALAVGAVMAVLALTPAHAVQPVGTAFTYQGRLNDGGLPANGNYDLIFNLYDSPTNGNAIGTFSIYGAVPVANGLFTVELNSNGEFGPNAFNGQARWLAIGVRTNNNNIGNPWVYLSPRQPLNPAPQAFYALNAGTANSASNALTAGVASTVADGSITLAKLAPGALAWTNVTGVSAGAGLVLGPNNQLSANFAGSGSANTVARGDHNHFGAIWGGNVSFGLGLSVTNAAANSTALFGQQGTGSGFPYVFGNTAGVWGESSQGSGVYGASATFRGVQGISLGAQGSGVYGLSLSASGTNYGLYGKSSSTNSGAGAYGQGAAASGNPSKSWLNGQSVGLAGDSAHGIGVAGFSDDMPGVFGSSVNEVGVSGQSVGYIGVFGQSGSAGGAGVEGFNNSGVALKASGTGIIQSDADSVLWFPATFLKDDVGAPPPHFFANAVYVEVTPVQTGTISWAMPLNLPGTLYGQNVTVKTVEVYYQCSAGARSYVTQANLYTVSTDATFVDDFVNGNATGNSPTKLSLAVNRQLSATQGFQSLLISVIFGNTADWIRIYGVKVVIGHK